MLNFGTEFKTNLKKLYLIALTKVKLFSNLEIESNDLIHSFSNLPNLHFCYFIGLGLLLQEQAVIHCSSGMLKG